MTIQALYPSISPSLSLDFANTKKLDGRITFARASSARFYDGRSTAKAEENLLTFSQQFDAGWAVESTSLVISADTGDTAAPDATSTAEKITASATTQTHILIKTVTATSETRVFSFFAKKGTLNYVQFAGGGDANVFANFDLDTGVVGTKGSSVSSSSIVDFGNGWYRCISVYASVSTITAGIVMVTNASAARRESWAAAGTETLYIWGAQLEQRAAVTAYTPTTTQPITNYIPVLQSAADNVARFDHNPVTSESLGFLVEEQRVNLLTYSEQFDDASWTKTNSTITANAIVAPDGTLTGDRFVEDTATGEHSFGKSNAFTSGTVYTQSIYVKAAGRTLVRVGAGNVATWGASVIVDLTTGAITNNTAGTAAVQNAGNGWYRISITGTALATASTSVAVRLVSTGTTTSYTGDGFSGVFLWGAQLEAGATPSSYIPTVASQVTRAADAPSMTGANFSSWFSQGEGTLYAEARLASTTGRLGTLSVDGNALTNGILLDISNGNFRTEGFYNSSGQWNISSAGYVASTDVKQAIVYQTNNVALFANGSQRSSTDVSALIPNDINRFEIGGFGTAKTNGHIRKLSFYPKALTAANLVALTS